MSYPYIGPEISFVPQPTGTYEVTPVPEVTLSVGDGCEEDPVNSAADEKFVDTSLIGNDNRQENGETDIAGPEEHTQQLEHGGLGFAVPRLTKEKVLNNFRQWEQGEPVESQAAAVGALLVTEAEDEILRTIQQNKDPSFNYLKPDDWAHASSLEARYSTGFTDAQLQIIDKLDKEFVEIVHRDVAANGLSDAADFINHYAQAGIYDPDISATGWHVDLYKYPALRYVASLGDAGATSFGVGMMRRSDLHSRSDTLLDPSVGPAGKRQLVNHGVGTVSRFLANQSVHNSPFQKGFRVFFTISVALPRSWYSR